MVKVKLDDDFYMLTGLEAKRLGDDGGNKSEVPRVVVASDYDKGVANINQPTELGEIIREINKDHVEKESKLRMSSIDMRTRLHFIEVAAITSFDALTELGLVPIRSMILTRQKKRLAVSLGGKGREEMVEIVGAERGNRQNMGFWGRVKNVFAPPKV